MAKYPAPLLVRGRALQGAPPASSVSTGGTLLSGRGPCVAVDLVSYEADLNNCFATFIIGGQNVLQQVDVNYYQHNALPGNYQPTFGNYGENQTLQVTVVNGDPLVSGNFSSLEYYANPYNVPGKVQTFLTSQELSTKRVGFGASVPAGNARTFSFVVPKNRGSIWAVQPYVSRRVTNNINDIRRSTLSAAVNGVEIIQTLPAAVAATDSSRKMLFPIDIDAGSTFEFTVDNLGGAVDLQASILLYFVPDQYCAAWQK